MNKYNVLENDEHHTASSAPKKSKKKHVWYKPAIFLAALTTLIVLGVFVILLARSARRPYIPPTPPSPDVPKDPYKHAIYLLTNNMLMDSHNDLPWAYKLYDDNVSAIDLRVNQSDLDTDIPKIREGHLGAQIWSVYVSCSYAGSLAVQATMEQIDVVYRLAEAYPDVFEIATSSAATNSAWSSHHKVASLMGMEGGHCINNSIGALRSFYQLGVRYMTLTHSCSTSWAQSSSDTSGDVIGLTEFGKEIVFEMNRMGMMVDLSHVAVQTMDDSLNATLSPVIFSHSNALALCNTTRNVPDRILHRLKDNNGVIMINFYAAYICESFRLEQIRLSSIPNCTAACVNAGLTAFQANQTTACTVSDVADHIDYIKNLIGVDYIGIGSDFDGVDFLPVGLENVGEYPNLFAELVRRQYSDTDIVKIMSGNMMRVLAEVEQQSASIKQKFPIVISQ
eukprot:TRINITY_DN2683_c0_g1_i1.p1 TRINITY_DN2683_c0_g1~~TRINITY_DN2683_c0_g1_i1.p1  ORF type:complete len:451 (-),score=111.16 TRINITY_DN2683_c0_g1_i1:39-1391(-)